MKKLKKKLLIVGILLFIININLFSQGDSISSGVFEDIFSDLYKKREVVRLRNILDFSFGVSQNTIKDKNFSGDLALTNNVEIKYGFFRQFNDLGVRNIFFVGSEYLMVGLNGTTLKPKSIDYPGIISDGWSFGFAYTNGYGYVLKNKSKLLLYHTGGLNWTRIDVDINPDNSYNYRLLDEFDEQFHAGSLWEAGVKYQLLSFLYADIGYRHVLVFQEDNYLKWAISGSLELAAQRSLDMLAERYLKKYPKDMPWGNFVAKNLLSLLIYELRRSNGNWPISSTPPWNYDTYKISLLFVF